MQQQEPKNLFPIDRTLSLDELMERVRAEVARRRAAQATEHDGEEAGKGPADRLPRWLPASGNLPAKPAYSLDELLQFADEEFVATAYRVLLRRPPDSAGMTHYLVALRNGHLSKVEILGEIRFSEEGRKADVHVDGLLIPYKLHGLRRVPILGKFLAFSLALKNLPRLSRYLQTMESSSARAAQDMGRLINRIDEAVERRLEVVDEEMSTRATLASFRFLESRVDQLESRIEQMLSARASKDKEVAEIREFARSIEQRLVMLDEHEASLREAVVATRRGVIDLQRKALASVQASSSAKAESVGGGSASAESIFDAEYVSFEKAFRGSRDDIKERAAEYLSTFAEAAIEPGSGRILDLGCGRGEWLELLSEKGFTVTGVDMNTSMLDECRELGLDVVEGDAVAYLASLEDASVSAITSMHLVEHLPHDVMIRLIDEAHRVLKPGGILVLETPNPENITVGSCWFYMDPTHRNPIPPALLGWTLSNRGFDAVELKRLDKNRATSGIVPWSDDVPGAEGFNRLLAYFNAAPDYAAIGRKA
ncbi:methyltransferase domain-containing protein [Luteibacter sp. SG786]|uniref:methyltransferase domain-containing protein n=1 Tax=Luteibacter sp. SG786 TaxID=2587130 RepID=UPI001424422A|nr:methyltransferase domain-containing protein [Luteibacter sp. SG786]NII56419.1 O-antigen chain-terminating methyltransferase [Luteibacter sp. SG786]